jgi:heme oxygenase
MALRDKIAEKHDKAENHRFVKLLFSGEMPKNIYADFLFNQLVAYSRLESWGERYGLFCCIVDSRRADLMQED